MRTKTTASEKPKTVSVGNTPATPVGAAEHIRFDKRIKSKHEHLRKRYPEIHGRKVDWISHGYDDGYLFFNLRFTDGKNFSIVCSPAIVTNIVDFSDMKTGNNLIIREYFKRRKD